MNITRTRVARMLMVGATLGMTIGLATSGLTEAAGNDPQPPAAESASNTEPAATVPVVTPPAAPEPSTAPVPPATEPVAETTPPTTEVVAEPATTTTQPAVENTPPATPPETDDAPTASTAPPTPPNSVAVTAPSTPPSSAPAVTVASGPSRASVVATTALAKPTAPRAMAAVPTNLSGQVQLYWTAPSSNGGSAVTDYIIQRSPNGSSSWVTINDGVRSTTGYTVTGLANGSRYYFRVFARNAVGQSPASNTTTAIPRTKPTAARSLAAAATSVSGQIRLTWVAPASNGGSAITDYIIQRSPNGSSSWATINDGVRSTTGYTATGLASGTRYYFRVFAHNAVGNSASSTVVSGVPRAAVRVPGALSYFDVDADYDGFYFYWGNPVSTGGSPITNFVLQAYDSYYGYWYTYDYWVDPSWNWAFADVPGYGCGTFRMAAENAVGIGPYSGAVEACYWGYAAQDAARVAGPTKVGAPGQLAMGPA